MLEGEDAMMFRASDEQEKISIPWDIPNQPKFEDPYEYRVYLQGRLALAFRIFAKFGYDEGVAGHITVKDPVDPMCFWVNPFGVSWAKMKSSDLILVNSQGNVIAGGSIRRLNTGAFMIHHAVHTARPDALCAAHSHTIHGRAFSALGRKLDIITQDSCVFYNHQGLQGDFTGSVMDQAPGEAVARALGNNKLVILQNHGLLTAGETVESAVYWFICAEKCCQSQLLVDAAARGKRQKTLKIKHEDAQHAFDTVGNEAMGWFSAQPTFDDMIHTGGMDYVL